MSKLSDVVKNNNVKKDVYDKLVAKVNSIGTGRFVLKTKYDTDKSELEKKIPDTSGLVYDSKISEIEGKILDVTNLATKTALTTVENKILVTKTDFDTKLLSFNRKITSNKTKHVLVQNGLKRLEAFDLGYFIGKSHFKEDGVQNYLVF